MEESKPAVPQAILEMREREEEKKKKKEAQKMLTMGEKAKDLQPPEPDQYSVSHPYIAPMDM